MKRNQKRKTSNIKIAIISIMILTIIVLSIILFQPKNYLILTKEVPYEFGVENVVAFKLDTDKLYFGTTYPGGGAYRNVNITPEKDFFVKVRYEGDGIITVDENNFLINANQQKELEFKLHTTNLSMGNYSGIIFVEFYHPDYKNK